MCMPNHWYIAYGYNYVIQEELENCNTYYVVHKADTSPSNLLQKLFYNSWYTTL